MTIHEYRRVFRERWVSIVLVVLLGAAAGAGLHFLRPPKYTATLQMYISTRSVSPTEDVFAGEGVADRRVKSYVKLATSERVTSTVVRQLGLPTTPDELASRITAASATDAVVIDLFAVDTSPEQAAAIANADAQVLAGLVDELEAPTTSRNVAPVVLKIVQPASVPTSPTGRGLSQWVLLGILVGIAGGVVLALVRNAMDNTIKSLVQLRVASGVPNLGVISFDSQLRRRPLIVHDEPQSARAEAFRQLRTNVQFVDIENQHKILAIASPMASEGKTTTLVNLAIALGAAGGSVLIVEADLRRPRAADMLGMDRSVGLTSVIAGRVSVHQAIRSWSSGSVDLLASGPLPPNPSELLANPRMGRMLDELRHRYDVILVDTPPLVPVTDAAAIAPATDGVILLCEFHKTTRPQVEAAVEALQAVGAPIVGSVFTKVPGLGSHESFSPAKDRTGGGATKVDVAATPASQSPRSRPADRPAPVAVRRSAVNLLDAPTQKNLSPVGHSPVGASPVGASPVGASSVGASSVGAGPVSLSPVSASPVNGGSGGHGPGGNGSGRNGSGGSRLGGVPNGVAADGNGSGPNGSGPNGSGPNGSGPNGSGPARSGANGGRPSPGPSARTPANVASLPSGPPAGGIPKSGGAKAGEAEAGGAETGAAAAGGTAPDPAPKITAASTGTSIFDIGVAPDPGGSGTPAGSVEATVRTPQAEIKRLPERAPQGERAAADGRDGTAGHDARADQPTDG